MKKNKIVIRSSAAEFLIFERQKKEKGVEVRFEKMRFMVNAEGYFCFI